MGVQSSCADVVNGSTRFTPGCFANGFARNATSRVGVVDGYGKFTRRCSEWECKVHAPGLLTDVRSSRAGVADGSTKLTRGCGGWNHQERRIRACEVRNMLIPHRVESRHWAGDEYLENP